MKRKSLIYFNLRRIPQEKMASLLAAKRLGYQTLLISNTPSKLPKGWEKLIGREIIMDLSDTEAILKCVEKLSRDYEICGIPAFTETSIETSSLVANHLSLPALPIEAIPLARKKSAMREKLKNLPGVSARFQKIIDLNQLEQACETMRYPCIVKPINCSGSTGIFKINKKIDITFAQQELQKIQNPAYDVHHKTPSLEFLVEEYLEGEEVSVEGLIYNRQIFYAGITDKWTTPDYCIEYQHIFPTSKSDSIQKHILEMTSLILKTFGFDHCSFHLEGKVTKEGFKFIEVAARPGGDFITSHLLRYSLGIDFYEQLIKVSIGEKPNFGFLPQLYAGIRFQIAEKEGYYESLRGLGAVINTPCLENVVVETPVQTPILLPPNDYRAIRLYGFIGTSPDYQTLLENLEKMIHQTEPVICKK